MKNEKFVWPEIIPQLFRFGMVGGLATFVNSAIFILLADYLKMLPLVSNLIAFICAFCVSYTGHSYWTFKSTSDHKEKLIKFLSSSLIGLGINSCFVWIVMHVFHQTALVATLPMIFLTPIFLFLVNKLWVFNDAVT